jgi:signal transduction histidine kinase/ActR/RegA family two-component response regulator
MHDRVLVWASARDGRLTCGFLTDIGVPCVSCGQWEELAAEWDRGVGAVVLAGELLSESVVANLAARLAVQAPWSDVPVIIVAGADAMVADGPFALLGNVSVLQRPVALDTLRSTVRAALRSRERQYEIRDLLQQRDEAATRKDEFLAMLAHELRNPLAPLRTALELLKLDPAPQIVAKAKATMERQITHLVRLVDDLLDVSRITQGKIVLSRVAVDARQSVIDAVAVAQPVASTRSLTIAVTVPDHPVVIDADPVRLEQMLGNLIGNAIKFTPAGGAIRVSLSNEDGRAVMRVRDTGVGIPRRQLPYVFELFGQATPSLDRSHGGLGIGLTVVRRLAELHGGSAQVFSEGEGSGTEAVVALPTYAASIVQRPASGVPMPQRGAGKRVLLIEDNHDVAAMLAVYLQQIGHEVIQAHDGHTGVEAAVRHRPAVLVCDIGLPGLDGYEIARRVREIPHLHTCLLIAVSGYGEEANRQRARAAGFSYHLTKPADPALLAELIANSAAPQHDEAGGTFRETDRHRR